MFIHLFHVNAATSLPHASLVCLSFFFAFSPSWKRNAAADWIFRRRPLSRFSENPEFLLPKIY